MTEVTLVRLTLQIAEPWAVGTVSGSDSEIDLPIEVDPRDGTGTPTVPMTALAGSLRRHLTDAGSWLGPEPAAFEVKREEKPTPSKLWLLGAVVAPSALGAATVASRGRTRVDSTRGAADSGSLRTEQWVAPTTLDVVLEHPGRQDSRLLADLGSWAPFIGRGRSVGMGRARVIQGEAFTLDLSDERHVHWWLTDRSAWITESAEPPAECGLDLIHAADAEASSAFATLRVREPLHLGDAKGETSKPGASIPLLRSGSDAVVPGSSWKGVFRHRVGFILGCLGADAASVTTIEEALFGSLATGRGLLRFGTSCLMDARTADRTHVAIDRFTGGARDGALFALEAVTEGTPVDLTIDWAEGEMPACVRTLLLHVVRDLHDGLIRVGGHGSRGYGHVEVTDSTLDGLEPVSIVRLLEELGHQEETT